MIVNAAASVYMPLTARSMFELRASSYDCSWLLPHPPPPPTAPIPLSLPYAFGWYCGTAYGCTLGAA